MKSYNPFLMWGSYVGGILALFVPIPMMGSGGIPLLSSIPRITSGNIYAIFGLLLIFIVGFLIGWGIHSLVRALRR
jgi:hypothetical protein